MALAQIGEFSFMLSRLGADLGLLTPQASNALVAVAMISIVLNPVMYRLVKPVDRWTLAHPWLRGLIDRSRSVGAEFEVAPSPDPSRQAIVVGYGPTGRTVTRLLRENGFEPKVIEMNVNTVRELREQGVPAIYGDATHRDTLAQAGAGDADNLILTSAGPYLRDLAALRKAGAEEVVSAEGEVGLALTEMILQRLGATPDQMDRERDRVRSEFRPS